MAGKEDVKREVVRGLDKLIEIEEKRTELELELESRRAQITRLNADKTDDMEEINDTYRMIVKTYELDKKMNYGDSGDSLDVFEYSFYGMGLFYTMYNCDSKIVYCLEKEGKTFVDFTEEELRRRISLHRRKQVSQLKKELAELEIKRSKAEYNTAALCAECDIIPPFNILARARIKRRILESKRKLDEVETNIASKEAKIKDVLETSEKKIIQSAYEIQLLIKETLKLKEYGSISPDQIAQAEEKYRRLCKQNDQMLDQQEYIIRKLISKVDNIEELINIKNSEYPNSSRQTMASVVLKLAALESRKSREGQR